MNRVVHFEIQADDPKQAIAWQGYFVDTEGNTFGIHQPDKNAK